MTPNLQDFHSERIPVTNAPREWKILLGFIFALLLFIGIRFSNRTDLSMEPLKDKTQTDSLNMDTRVVVKTSLPTEHRSTKYWNHNVSKIRSRSIIAFTRTVDLETTRLSTRVGVPVPGHKLEY